MTTTFLSKAIALIARIEWGLQNILVLSPHSFSADKDGRSFSFHCQVTSHDAYSIMIDKTDCDLIVVYINNKMKGDNYVMLPKSCAGKTMSFEEIAKSMKKSWHAETNILHHS